MGSYEGSGACLAVCVIGSVIAFEKFREQSWMSGSRGLFPVVATRGRNVLGCGRGLPGRASRECVLRLGVGGRVVAEIGEALTPNFTRYR